MELTSLLTLSILLFSNISNISSVSVPIPILLPTDTFGGKLVTYISVVAAPARQVDKRVEWYVTIPTV